MIGHLGSKKIDPKQPPHRLGHSHTTEEAQGFECKDLTDTTCQRCRRANLPRFARDCYLGTTNEIGVATQFVTSVARGFVGKHGWPDKAEAVVYQTDRPPKSGSQRCSVHRFQHSRVWRVETDEHQVYAIKSRRLVIRES